MPRPVIREIGVAISAAQMGGRHPLAKPWKGQGPGVFELIEDHDGNMYRAVYTVRFREVVYVLHAFQKESPKGITTARLDVELVEREAQDCAGRFDEGFLSRPAIEESTGLFLGGQSEQFPDLPRRKEALGDLTQVDIRPDTLDIHA